MSLVTIIKIEYHCGKKDNIYEGGLIVSDELNLSYDYIKKVEIISDKIKYLKAYNSGLKEIILCEGIVFINCQINDVTSIDVPKSLKYLGCDKSLTVNNSSDDLKVMMY